MYKASNNKDKMQSRINYLLSENNEVGFPSLANLFKLFLTIPTNSACCERNFSTLKRLKNYLRTTVRQERLSNLRLIQIERDRSCQINQEDIITKFNAAAENRGRRLNL